MAELELDANGITRQIERLASQEEAGGGILHKLGLRKNGKARKVGAKAAGTSVTINDDDVK